MLKLLIVGHVLFQLALIFIQFLHLSYILAIFKLFSCLLILYVRLDLGHSVLVIVPGDRIILR